MDDFLKSIERLEALAKKLEDPNSGLGIPIVNPADLEEYAYRPGENIGEYFRRLGFDDSSLGDLKQTEFYQEYEEIPDFEDCVKEFLSL